MIYLVFEPLREGHASYTHVQEIIDGLANEGWRVGLITPRYDDTAALPGAVTRFMGMCGVWWRFLFAGRPDVVYARMHFGLFPPALKCRVLRIPLAIEVNGPVEDLYIAWPALRPFKALFDTLTLWPVRIASLICCVTHGLERLMASRVPKPSSQVRIVLPNGANTQLFRPGLPRPAGLVLPERYAIFFGTMAPWQGLKPLLQAATSADWPDGLELVFVGDGRLKPDVRRAAEMNRHIHYLDRVGYRDMPALIANASMSFVLTSDCRGRAKSGLLPIKMFESLACGTPVIATNQPEQAEFLAAADAGPLLESTTPQTICAAAQRLLQDPQAARAAAQRGRRLIETDYTWASTAKRLSNTLREQIATNSDNKIK